jgi:leader peptidase (prepilin peptidase)/N-methyltransferase
VPEYIVEIFVFIWGVCLGSFLNVCIYRLPLGKSIVFPPSACPQCNRRIQAYDNIPVISYLLLGGRCRNCGLNIPLRYWLVEIITGLTALAVYARFGLTPTGGFLFAFIAALIVVIFIDIDYRIIPDGITLPGIVICFLAAVFIGKMPWTESLAGILAGGGSLYLVALVYKLLTGVDGMGGGDIKLLAMIGAWCGWMGVFFTILVSSAAGALVGLLVMIVYHKNMKVALPYGPFLSLGAILYIFYGPELIGWYFGVMGY